MDHTPIQLPQIHEGIGDNIGRDKIIHNTIVNNILGKSVEYNNQVTRITDLQLYLTATTDPVVRLKISGQLNEAEDQLKQFKDDIIRLAEIFTRIEINTERLRIAKEHFEAGRLLEADAILKVEELAGDQLSLLTAKESKRQELQDIDEKLGNNANEYLVKARLRSLRYDSNDRIAETCEYFELSLKSSRQKEFLFEYAVFLHEHKYFNKAQLIYKELLGNYKLLAQTNPRDYESYVANMLTTIGSLFREKNDFENAEANFKEALEICRRLEIINLQAYEPSIAYAMDNLGVLYGVRNDFDQAEVAFKEVLKLYKKMASINLEDNEPNVARSLNNLGVLYKDKNDFEQAETIHKEALKIRKRLALINPQIYEPDVAKSQNSLGNLYSVKNDFELAEFAYKEALGIWKRFAKANPEVYELYIAEIQNDLGILYKNKNDFEQAEVAYKESLEIRKRFAMANPEVYEPDVANTLYNLGILHNAKKNFKWATIFHRNAMEIYERLARNVPQPFELKLAEVLLSYGLTLIEDNEITSAHDKILLAKKIAMKYTAIPLAQQVINSANRILEIE